MKSWPYKLLLASLLFFLFSEATLSASSNAAPYLAFSDLISGPARGIDDGFGSGTIVTVWGNRLGENQKDSHIYFIDSVGTKREAAHVYYWGNADGSDGPAKLFSSHRLQQISFSIPESQPGLGKITVEIAGEYSNTLPFTVRDGHIFHIKTTEKGGNNNNIGSFNSPWNTVEYALNGSGAEALHPGDIIYLHDGIKVENGLQVGTGDNTLLKGTESHPFALVAYPRSNVSFAGEQGMRTIRNFYNRCDHWIFSKISITTNEVGIGMFDHMRVVGVEITGPNVKGESMTGAIGGAGKYAGGAKILGVYIHNYGNNSTNTLQHVLYMSNRTGVPIEAYEIAYGRFENNGAKHTLHVYDQSVCGDWTGSFKFHHNFVKGNKGNAFNFNPNCSDNAKITTPVELYDNILIATAPWSECAISIASPSHTGSIKIYNNTIYGYNKPSQIEIHYGYIELVNNIFYDTKNVPFWNKNFLYPTHSKHNLYYSIFGNQAPEGEKYVVVADPKFYSSTDYRLLPQSAAIGNGDQTINNYVHYGFDGNILTDEIGAFAFENNNAIVLTIDSINVK